MTTTVKRGFTLIELLVVIAIIALLMAVLMPSLQRSRKQAKTLMCQSQLKQWGLIFSMYTQDNQERLPTWLESGSNWWPMQLKNIWSHYRQSDPLFVCPRANKPKPVLNQGGSHDWSNGSTFEAWTLVNKEHNVRVDGSYGVNPWCQFPAESAENQNLYWKTALVKTASQVPMVMDSMSWWANSGTADPLPPAQEDQWVSGTLQSCISRHEGTVNGLFMDWSIRKIPLKQLWTFKWHPQFNTSGPWTGVGDPQSVDWPEWMR
jgi:prepilin-type N-terminal cleavage/methylation domain-containing protein